MLSLENASQYGVSIHCNRKQCRLVDPAAVNLTINSDTARALVDVGSGIQRAANSQFTTAHPEFSALNGLSYVMFVSKADDGRLKGTTILPLGQIDQSPCGAGNSARMALMHSRGQIQVGIQFTALSIIDSEFQVKLLKTIEIYGRNAIVPSITGRDWIHGKHQIGLDPTHPYPKGYLLSDCWGAFDLVN